jgi:hypothetical protein
MKRIMGALLVAAIFTSGSTPASAATFKNCAALTKVYPGGVAKSKSAVNVGGETTKIPKVNLKVYNSVAKKLDRDKDGIACEN